MTKLQAIENWKRCALEAEHWLRLASKRQDTIDRLKKQIAKLKGGKL